jgi:hypothetical protein
LNPEVHVQSLKETFELLVFCVDKGIETTQRTIGFHTSLGTVEMLELYLHTLGVFPVTYRLNHAWLKSQKKIREKIPYDFPEKERIIELAYYIEKNRDILCYGRAVGREKIMEQLEYFHELREIFGRLGLDEIL